MLKTKAIIAAMVYTLSSLGLLVHVHFCCGGLAGVSIIAELTPCSCDHHDHECGGGDDCCDFESFYLNMDEDHQIPPNIQIPADFEAKIPQVEAFAKTEVDDREPIRWISTRAGPPDGRPATYIDLCSLVYYG